MNNTTYIEDWNNRHSEFDVRRNEFNEEHSNIKEKLIPEIAPFLKWIGFILVIGGIIWLGYCYLASRPDSYLAFVGFGVGATSLIIFAIINREILPKNRVTRKAMRGVDKQLEALADEEWKIKYDLSFNYAQGELVEVSHDGDLKSYHSHQIIKFADIYERVKKKDSKGRVTTTTRFVRTVMYSVNGVKLAVYVGMNQYLTNYEAIDTFFIDSISEENDYQTINAKPDVYAGKFDISIHAKKVDNGSLHIRKPYKSSKFRWNKEYPELNGEYYPKVLAGSSQDLFGYFTPRRIEYFKTNDTAKLIKEINGSKFDMKKSPLSIDYLHIKDDWGTVTPDEIIKRVEQYSGTYCLAQYDMENHNIFRESMLDIFK